MKVAILAGGFGTRLVEETEIKPKALVEIGGKPILWHILKHFSHHGMNEFYIALGYRAEDIKRWFMDLTSLSGNMTIELGSGAVRLDESARENWTVHLIDTGLHTNTGGRIRRLARWLDQEPFLVTYCDGVCDVNLDDLVRFHRARKATATVTAVRPPARFGGLIFQGDLVREFTEKPQIGEGWINGGYIVCEPGLLEYLKNDEASLEVNALEPLATQGQLAAYKHDRFWQCMDTMRDRRLLEGLWQAGNPPWKVWR